MIRELHAAGGLTVVMVSHNMDDISSPGDPAGGA